jgi:hypothetical protein
MRRNIITFTLVIMLISFVVLFVCFFRNHYVDITKDNYWAIGIYEGKSPLDLGSPVNGSNPVLQASDVTDVKALFVADPFLFKKDSSWFMFFEVMNALSGQGDIGLAVSRNGKDWKYKQIVLDELHHLSYPYVFQWNDEIYMIPESAESKKLSLYRSVDFPDKWEYVSILLDGQYGDHALLRYNDLWWLFACSEPYTNNTLKLFFCESLEGRWVEHPLSPIIKNNADIARPGGRIILWEDRIIRYSQDCLPTYGKALNAFEIKSLTKTDYEEVPCALNPILKNSNRGWNRHGMHHLDPVEISPGYWIGAVDGYKRSFTVKVEY